MSTDELTAEQVKAIAAEIDAWVAADQRPGDWGVEEIAQLYEIHQECYLVRYENRVVTVFMRDERGRLRPSGRLSYYAVDDFDRQKTLESKKNDSRSSEK